MRKERGSLKAVLRTLFRTVLAIALAPFFLIACENAQPKSGTAAPVKRAEPVVRKVNVEGIAKAVQEHKGRVVLLDVWATWCGPCVEKFPHLAERQSKYGRDDLAVVALSIDDIEDLDGKVMPFLGKQKTDGLDLLIYAEGDHDTLVNSIDREWAGEVPAAFVYDRAGKRVRSFTGDYDEAALEKALKETLNAKKD